MTNEKRSIYVRNLIILHAPFLIAVASDEDKWHWLSIGIVVGLLSLAYNFSYFKARYRSGVAGKAFLALMFIGVMVNGLLLDVIAESEKDVWNSFLMTLPVTVCIGFLVPWLMERRN